MTRFLKPPSAITLSLVSITVGLRASLQVRAVWFSTYLEEYAGAGQIFQAQVISLVTEGTFDRFPDLRVALIEGGFTWLPSVMWRIDKEWRGLRHITPWIKRLPSDYMREHLRFTLQPMDAPPDPKQFLRMIGQLDSDDMLMFSTDYPHWQFDSPDGKLCRWDCRNH